MSRGRSSFKRVTIFLGCKEPEEFSDLIKELGLTKDQVDKYFENGEYATFELLIDKNLKVNTCRIVPVSEVNKTGTPT